jgi:hypothetical protein
VYCVTEQERTKRESVALLREAIAAHLACWIEVRRALLDGLLLRLDAAVASRDTETAGALLGAIVDLAKASPLAGLADVQRAATALRQEGAEWRALSDATALADQKTAGGGA